MLLRPWLLSLLFRGNLLPVFGWLFGGRGFRILNITLGQSLKYNPTFKHCNFDSSFVINALMFWAASFVKGFSVAGFWPAFWGSIIMTLVSLIGKKVISE